MLYHQLTLSARWLVVLALACALVSCSGDESKAKKKPTEDPTELEESVNELLEKLRKDGADAEKLAEVESLIEKAAKSRDKGKAEAAISTLKRAERTLTQLQTEQAKLSEDHKKLAADKTSAVDARKRAETAKAAQLAPEEFKRAQDSFAKAEAAAAKKSAAGIVQAKQHYQQSKEGFDEAIKQAVANEGDKKRADEEKKVMLAKKEEARTKGGEQKAALAWSSAEQTEREAEALLAKGEFLQAKDTFAQAQTFYVETLTAIQMADEEAARMAELKKADEEAAKAAQVAEPELTPEEDDKTARPPTVTPRQPTGAAVAAPGSIAGPTGYDPTADFYKQELDAEDEEFLNTHYAELTPSKKLEYDITTGMVRMDYTDGIDVKRDGIYDPALPKREHLQFRPVVQQNQRAGGTGGFGPEQQKQLAAFSFAANTKGQIFFPVPLRFYARIDYLMQINTMDQSNSFNVFLMYDVKKNAGYMTDWVRAGTTRGTGGKGIPPKFLQSSNEWFDKVNLKSMVVEYLMTGPKAGTLTNIYNNDDAANEGEDKLTVKVSSAAYQRGRIGFRWDRVKFQVVDLVITGVLDKQEAVRILREKLKKPKAAVKKADGGEEEEPKPEPGDNPAASPPEGTTEATKKPKKDLDF